jgi:hypothetical protein
MWLFTVRADSLLFSMGRIARVYGLNKELNDCEFEDRGVFYVPLEFLVLYTSWLLGLHVYFPCL